MNAERCNEVSKLQTMLDEQIDWNELKQDIIKEAPKLGIDKIGFASADPFLDLKDILIRHRALGRESGFEEPDIDKRVYPELSMEGPRSIISIAIAYPSKMSDPPRSEPGAYRGIFSRSSWGEDYHHVLRRRLVALKEFMRERVPQLRAEIMVDTGALSDRAVAERAGIGWSGKNCSIITPEFGSWVYLGEMITNIPFMPDTPIEDQCGDCNLCIEACPTGALVGPGQLNAKDCLSYVTQTKGSISDEMKEKVGNRLYGCDTCQVVCPKNKGLNWTHHEELQPDHELVKPLLIPLLKISNRHFKESYGRSAGAWRGKKPIQRQAIISLGMFKDESAIPLLADLLRHDPRPDIRETIAWSLGKIGTVEALTVLNERLPFEDDEKVIEAIKRAQDAIGIGVSMS